MWGRLSKGGWVEGWRGDGRRGMKVEGFVENEMRKVLVCWIDELGRVARSSTYLRFLFSRWGVAWEGVVGRKRWGISIRAGALLLRMDPNDWVQVQYSLIEKKGNKNQANTLAIRSVGQEMGRGQPHTRPQVRKFKIMKISSTMNDK